MAAANSSNSGTSSVSAAPAADLATLAGEQEELDKELDGIMKDIRQVNKDKKQQINYYLMENLTGILVLQK